MKQLPRYALILVLLLALVPNLAAPVALSQTGGTTPTAFVPLGTVKITHSNGRVQQYWNGAGATSAMRGTALQTAVAALVAGDKLEYGPGDYEISTALALPSNCTFQGPGPSGKLILASGITTTPFYTIQNSDASGGNSNITIRDVYIDGNNSGNTDDTKAQSGIRFDKVTGGIISNCYFVHFGRLNTSSCMGITTAGGCADIIITGNHTDDCVDGLNLTAGSRFVVTNNNCRNTSKDYTINLFGLTNSVISNNVCYASYKHGIEVTACSDNVISNNHIFASGKQTNATYDGINLTSDSNNNLIIGNQVRKDSTGNLTRYGINIGSSLCDGNVVEDNDLYLSGATGALSDSGTTSVFRNNITALATFDGSAVTLIHADGTKTPYGPGTTDATRGTALLAALAVAASGETVEIPTGTFDVQTTRIVVPAGVTLKGAGKYATTIKSAASSSATEIYPNSNSHLSDFTLQENLGDGVTGLPIGAVDADSAAFTGVRLDRIRVNAQSDGFYLAKDVACSAVITDCEFNAEYDCVRVSSGGAAHLVELYNTRLNAAGPFGAGESRAVAVSNGTVTLRNCDIIASNGGATTTAGLYVDGTRGIIDMSGGSIATSASSGATPYDVKFAAAGIIRTRNVRGSGTNGAPTINGGTPDAGWIVSPHGNICEGRLTLESGVPVSTTDQTAKTTLYYTNYVGNRTAQYDGNVWFVFTEPEIALPLGTLANATNYDVFQFVASAVPSSTNTSTEIVTFGSATGWATGSVITVSNTIGGLSAGTTYFYNAASSTTGSFHTTLANALAGTSKVNLTANVTSTVTGGSLELSAAWDSATARHDALTTQDGVKVKSGATTRRYLGTIRTTNTTTTEDSGGGTTTQVGGKRFVFNDQNRVARQMSVIDTTDTWAYTTATIRQANAGAGAGNKVEYVTGDAATSARAEILCTVALNANSAALSTVGVGVDSITTYAGIRGTLYQPVAANIYLPLNAKYRGNPGLGYHYLSWNEKGADVNCTFCGDAGVAGPQSGMTAEIDN